MDVNITENANSWTLFQYFPCDTGITQLFRVSLIIILVFIQFKLFLGCAAILAAAQPLKIVFVVVVLLL